MKNLFNTIQVKKPGYNRFDLSHDVKLSLNMGDLVPIMCTECVPGDKFGISCESLIRFAPMVAPVMHKMNVTMHYFFVPTRIIWENFEAWLRQEGEHTVPYMNINDGNYSQLCDYFGLPTPDDGNQEKVSALPFYAYQKIFNEWYRDQTLIEPVIDEAVDGDNTDIEGLRIMRKRAWEHDYFTAALPSPQYGATVDIPLGEVTLKDDWQEGRETSNIWPVFKNADGTYSNGYVSQGDADTGGSAILLDSTGGLPNAYDPAGSLQVSATTINDLRRATKLQEWAELMARTGQRYAEMIRGFWGVKSSDARLQRPEYITGTKSPVVISEVLNSTGTEELPQGNMSGHGMSVVNGKYGHYFCEEHGYIIGIMSVLPNTAYQQGIPKHFLKTESPFQLFWPQFAHIGEQEVLCKEVYAFQGPEGERPFGYVPRYAEYKFEQNRVAGDFKNTLDFWHMGRIFEEAPRLNEAFVTSSPTHRIFAVTDPNEQKLYAHVFNKINAFRMMPLFGTPSF